MSKNAFLHDESFYQRDLNPLKQYVEQSSFYLSKMKGITIEEAKSKIMEKMKTKSFPDIRDPTVQFYERHNYEDRELTVRSLSYFLKTINTENLTMAPSLTCYVNSKERLSLHSEFTDENVKIRNISRKEAAKWKALGDNDKFMHFNGQQENKKLSNNAMSGAYSSGGSVIRNPTAHSSLTSTTRTMTSIGNASNERLISGNRHYRNPEITLNNIVVLAQTVDTTQINNAIKQFHLKIPTVEETMDCIEFSTSLYWVDQKQLQKIRDFIEKLTDEERATIVYTGDLYQLRRLNQDVIHQFITKLSQKITDQVFEDPVKTIKATDEMYVNYAHQICLEEVKGIGKDYSLLTPEKVNTVAATCSNITATIIEYEEFVKTFFLTSNLPCSVAYIRDSIRRTVVLSDTDSTMFSCDEWVQWYFGDIRFTEDAFAVAGAVMFMATQCIAHNLAIYSANLNVDRKKLFMAAMKPEFVFSIFALTSAGKHYFTYVNIKEGSVYKKMETEIKGVHLKSSASPKIITDDVKVMMEEILSTPLRGEKISLSHWVEHVANLERRIKLSVLAGDTTYLGRLNIKPADAYSGGPEQSNYRNHLFWNEVFGPKYGMAPNPTYTTVKFPTTLSSKRVLSIWFNQIQDEELRSRLIQYFERTQRKDMNTIYVSQDHVFGYGIPKEIEAIIDVESLVIDHLKAHRLVLESIGFFAKQDLNLSQQGY